MYLSKLNKVFVQIEEKNAFVQMEKVFLDNNWLCRSWRKMLCGSSEETPLYALLRLFREVDEKHKTQAETFFLGSSFKRLAKTIYATSKAEIKSLASLWRS